MWVCWYEKSLYLTRKMTIAATDCKVGEHIKSFRGSDDGVNADKYRKEGKIAFEDEKGKAVGNVFREK